MNLLTTSSVAVTLLLVLCAAPAAATLRHPLTGSSDFPPQGAKCRAHGKEDTQWNPRTNYSDPPVPIYLNESLVPITWNFTQGCPMVPGGHSAWGGWACCSHAQYQEMVEKERLLTEVMHGCRACAEALNNFFCWFTCGPWQYNSSTPTEVIATPSGETQVLTTQVAVDHELSQRIWKSCENAGIGIETFKKTYEQNKVMGIFDLIVDFAPSTTLKNGSSYKTLGDIKVKPTCDEHALGWNVSTPNCEHSCSDSEFPQCPNKKPNCGSTPPPTMAPAATPLPPATTTPRPHGHGGECSQYTSCSACTDSRSGTCGFCRATKTCSMGTSSGPDQGSCPGAGQWSWLQSQC